MGLQHVFLANVLSGTLLYTGSAVAVALLIITVLVVLVFYFWSTHEQPIFFLLLIGATVQFLIVAAFLSSNHFFIRYLTPLFGIFAITIAAFISNMIPSRSTFLRLFMFGVFVMFIFASSPKILERLKTVKRHLISDPIQFLDFAYVVPPFIMPLKDEITAIKERGNEQNLNFFDIQSYYYWHTPIFWVPLEHELGKSLILVDDNEFKHFRAIGSYPKYIFLDCLLAQDVNLECINPFLRTHPDFRIIREITPYPPIYVAQRIP